MNNAELTTNLQIFSQKMIAQAQAEIAKPTQLVIQAIQQMLVHLEDQIEPEMLKALQNVEPTPSTVLAIISNLLHKHQHNERLRSMLMPAMQTLQFEDRVSQKLTTLQKIYDAWPTLCEEKLDENALALRLAEFSICREQDEIIARHVPGVSSVLNRHQSDDIELF